MTSSRIDWHKAASFAIQIDLRDYSHLLEYKTDYILPPYKNRIDLLVLQKNLDIPIPKHIASIFRTHNIFEHKGIDSLLTTNDYYKAYGNVGCYISSYPGTNTLSRKDVTLSFLTFHYPGKLFKYLTKECKKTVEKPFSGVYYILDEMYATQVLVLKELLPEESLYLYCLKKDLDDQNLINTLAKDYALNRNDILYTKYMHQFIKSHRKGDQLMVFEELFRPYGTRSEKIAKKAPTQANEQAEKLYISEIQKFTSEYKALTLENKALTLKKRQLTAEVNKMKQLLAQHNISY